jgi:hypothetical protein
MNAASDAELLQEAAELLGAELDLLLRRRWDALPELKKRKVVLAAQLSQRQCPAGATEALRKLEQRTRAQMRGIMRFNAQRILALQEVQLFCMECNSISFRPDERPADPLQ